MSKILKSDIDKVLDNYFKEYEIFSDILTYAVKYGKRIRPILCIESYNIFQKASLDSVIDFAIALELIHNYSLIHDDLPCMDNDDYRRGNLTVHKKYGETSAVLAGDALLNVAFEIMTSNINKTQDLNMMKNKIRAMGVIANHSGIQGMIGGQVLDTDSAILDYSGLLQMYQLKTGALISAATMTGAILGGADEVVIANFEKYGNSLGLAFQLQDDLLDKDKDISDNKLTSMRFMNEKEIRNEIDYYTDLAIDSVSIYDHSGFLTEFVRSLKNRLV